MTATVRLSPRHTLTYRCDVVTHRVVVSDAGGRPRFAFGGYGSRPGQLDMPLDLVLVAPEFHGERLPDRAGDLVWLAVADYGNRRVQVFDLDGCVVGTVSDETDAMGLGGPCQLKWRPPVLDVQHPDGRRASVHLAAALLYGSARAFTRHRQGSQAIAHALEVRH